MKRIQQQQDFGWVLLRRDSPKLYGVCKKMENIMKNNCANYWLQGTIAKESPIDKINSELVKNG
jgi:hypothetical protein